MGSCSSCLLHSVNYPLTSQQYGRRRSRQRNVIWYCGVFTLHCIKLWLCFLALMASGPPHSIATFVKTCGAFVVILLSNATVRKTQAIYLDELGRHELHDHCVFAFIIFLGLALVVGFIFGVLSYFVITCTRGEHANGAADCLDVAILFYFITIGIMISQAVTVGWLRPHEEKCSSRWITSNNSTGAYGKASHSFQGNSRPTNLLKK